MDTLEFLDHLRAEGVRLRAEGGRLRVQAPDGGLKPELRAELTRRKAEVLEWLGAVEDEAIEPVSRDRRLPLSFAQQRMWLLDRFEPGKATYNSPAAIALDGPLEITALRRCLAEMVARHEILRTRFAEDAEGAFQVIDPPSGTALLTADLSALPAARRGREADRLAGREAARPFDLQRGPLFRNVLVVLGHERHRLLWGQHHIVTDGDSFRVLTREFASLYPAFTAGRRSPLPDPGLQYADFAAWQRRRLRGAVLEPHLAFWRRRLAGLQTLELPTDRPRPAQASGRGRQSLFVLPRPLLPALQAWCRPRRTTLFVALLTVFQALLRRYSGQSDVAVGSPVAGRTHRQLSGLVGMFVNALVLRADVPGDLTFDELLAHVSAVVRDALVHQDVPFELLVEDLRPVRDPSRTPLFQVMFQVEKSWREPLRLGELVVRPQELDTGTAKFDLAWALTEAGDGLHGSVELSSDLYDRTTAVRLWRHFEALAQACVGDPGARIAEVPLLSAPERAQLLREWNDTRTSYPRQAAVHELFAEQAARRREDAALLWEEGGAVRRMTYGELDRRSSQLARYLRRRGVRLETPVGLLVDRCPEMVVGILGILKAGGSYVPLDPGYPEARLQVLLQAVRVPLVLSREPLAGLLPAGRPFFCLDTGWPEAGAEVAEPPAVEVPAEALCYVMFTSGTTGRPKGVAVPHRAVTRLVRETRFASFGPDEVFLQLAPISFDASTLEVWGALLHGGRLVLHPPGPLSLDALAAAIGERGVTTLWLTAGLFHEMAQAHPSALVGVRQLLVGGDVVSVRHARDVVRRMDGRLIDGYGPTENTTFTCCHPMRRPPDPARSIPIGRPISNTTAYLLDRHLLPVPLGVSGILYAGGDGLARGYAGRPAATASAFVPHLWGLGDRLYRTGDLARRLADGTIEFLGRADHQVKVRGFRIEPGEIETALESHPGVRRAVVLPRSAETGEPDKRLVAYVVTEGLPAEPPALRSFLEDRLPSYMVPSIFVGLEELPLDPNGKVDRSALDRWDLPDSPPPAASYVAPRTALERSLAEIWAEVLGVERVGTEDDFFDLGGHSLLATRVVSRIRRSLGLELELGRLFSSPRIVDLAAELQGGPGPQRLPPIVRADRGRPLPLSFAQQRLWFLAQLEPRNPQYDIPAALAVEGPLEVGVLRRVLDEVVRRHEALRTRFVEEAGEPVQVVDAFRRQALPVVDLAGLPEIRRAAERHRLAAAEAVHLFDLARGPLLRTVLLRRAADRHLFLVNQHHIVSDGWSIGILVREVNALYRAFLRGEASPLPPLPVQYADFAVWQRGWLRGEALDRQLEVWRTLLNGIPSLDLPTDRPRPAARSGRGRSVAFALPAPLGRAIEELGRPCDATLFMTLLAAFQVLLARYSGQRDVAVGTPIAGRRVSEVEELIGFFVNTLVLRSRFTGAESFSELLAGARETALRAYEHQDVPFERLVEELQVRRDRSRTPLFQVMFALLDAGWERPELGEAKLMPLAVEATTAKFDLTLNLVPEPDGSFAGSIEYAAELFDETSMLRFGRSFVVLLRSLARGPDGPVWALDVLAPSERRQLLIEWNDTEYDYREQDECVHRLFEAQAGRSPEALALVSEGVRLTYEELDERAGRLASLLRSHGVGPDVVVALCAERSPEMVVGVLGILKAGGAYLPLDPSYPADRLAFMLRDSGARVLVTHDAAAARLPEEAHSLRLVFLNDGDEGVVRRQAAAPRGDNLAYVIYTSGSTGRPKGVMISHRAITGHMLWMRRRFQVTEADTVFFKTPFSFDASVWELFLPLCCGGRLAVARPGGHQDSAYLAESAGRYGVTVLQLVPSMLRALVEEEAFGEMGLRLLFAGGEAFPEELAKRLHDRRGDLEVYNLYGPTEVTIDATFGASRNGCPGGTVEIGQPIDNVRAHLLDAAWQPVPLGAAGELHLGGRTLGRGYLGRPALTAERFVPDPFAGPGERLYRTGDLVRRGGGGRMEFLGRIDHQVKVRGFRIELGEVETTLASHPAVHAAVVLGREDIPGESRLVAYVVAAKGDAPETGELRAFVAGRLPAYMVPEVFVVLEKLPHLPNGKVDRRALPAPESRGTGELYVAPRNAIEQALADIYADLLHVERIGVTDDFFALGGHSLLATRLVSRIRREMGRELKLADLFDAPRIAELVQKIEDGAASGLPPLRPAPRDRPLPLSFAQQRLWFLSRLEPDNPQFNMTAAVALEGRLDLGALKRSFDEVVRRHETLRTRLVEGEEGPVQRIDLGHDRPLPIVDLKALEIGLRKREQERLATAEGCRPFDLENGPLLRTLLLRLAPDEHVLLVNQHHVISDGWSTGILIRELTSLYPALAARRGPRLPELPVQYADFAVWQRQWLDGQELERQLAWWREHLAGAGCLEMPTDRLRPPVFSGRGERIPVELPPTTTGALEELARQHRSTLFMVLLAAFQTLLFRHSGQRDLVVGTPAAGRRLPEVEGLIGFFVNTLALRADLSPGGRESTFLDLLKLVRTTTLQAFAHQDVPFEKLVETVVPRRDRSRPPLVQALLALQNLPQEPLELEGLILRPLPVDSGTTQFDLSLDLTPGGGRLAGSLRYAADLFDRSTVRRLGRHFQALLDGLAESPGLRLSELPLLTAAEGQQLREWNDTATPARPWRAFPEQLAGIVASSPEALAVVAAEEHLTYGELYRRTGRLASYLRRRGVLPEGRVGVLMERSLESVTSFLAILRAGGVYVPLDPAYPAERLAYMAADARLEVVLTHRGVQAAWTPDPARALDLKDEAAAIETCAQEPPAVDFPPESLAYVIYTSGSTGRPKGAQLTHRGVASLIESQQRVFGEGPGSQILQFASLSFDASIFELLMALASGATLHLAPRAETLPGAELLALLGRRGITNATLPPSALAVMDPGTRSLRNLVVAGEPSTAVIVDAWGRDSCYWNAYGPTEATVWSTVARCRPGEGRPTIGRPVPNQQAHVVDRRLRRVPIGVSGELLLGGVTLTRGYLGRPGLTARCFVPDPFAGLPGVRLYRTGDLARLLADGRLDFLGRIDHQVKIRGFRIEPGEVEVTLAAHPAVAEAVVLAREEAPGDRRLVAYAVAAQTPPKAGELLAFLAERMPGYMVPSAVLVLEELPRLPNGKTDRATLGRLALPAPEGGSEQAYVAPATGIERAIAAIFAELLHLERAGRHDDFFALGGHSLLATRVVSRVRRDLGVAVPVAAVFSAPTPAALAERVDAGRREAGLAPPFEAMDRADGAAPTASYAQERLWFLDQLDPGSPAYNIPTAARLLGELHPQLLERALQAVVDRHDTLRTRFVATGGRPVPVISDRMEVSLPVTTVTSAELPRRLAEAAAVSFDLAAGPLFDFRLLRLESEEHVFLVNLHHVIADGWSLGVLIRELATSYGALRQGTKPVLPELPVQYGAFAAWQRRQMEEGGELDRQLAYWRERLRPPLTALELPLDRRRPAVQTYDGDRVVLRMEASLCDGLRRIARHFEASLFMVLVSAFKVLLKRWSGQDDVLVGFPIAGRNRPEVEGLIGIFLNTLVLRTDLSGEPTFREVLARVRRDALGAFSHQDVPFEKLLAELYPERDLSRTPIFQVFFNMLNLPESDLDLPGLTVEVEPAVEVPSKFDLTVYAAEQGDGTLAANLVYNAHLFDRARIEELAEQYRLLLAAMAADPDAAVGAVPLVTQRAAVLLPNPEEPLSDAWRGPLHAGFARRAAEHPDRAAVVDQDDRWSYGELDARANQLAHRLLAQGLRPGEAVAIFAQRNASLVWALLGILKAGGVFVILDPAYPVPRLLEYVRQSRPRALLEVAGAGEPPAEVLDVLDLRCRLALPRRRGAAELLAGLPAEDPGVELGPDDPVYVAFTSGSTGKPKGILGRHGSITHFLPWLAETFGFDGRDRHSLLSALSHDPLHRDVFMPLFYGATLCVPDPDQIFSPGYLARWVAEERVSILNLTPAMLRILATGSPEGDLDSLRYTFLIGDVLTRRDVAALYALSSTVTAVNFYGSTETQRSLSYHPVPREEVSPEALQREKAVLPLGRGILDVQVLVLNRRRELAGVGELGEIYFRSHHMALGYLSPSGEQGGKPRQDESLSRERFLTNPFTGTPGDRLYRTGDLGRYRADGGAEFAGRADRQAKVRGFRIELPEVEAALAAHPGVRECAVGTWDDSAAGRRLAAWVVPAAETPAVRELRSHLLGELPDYMVPAAFVFLDAMPLTRTGKLDRAALPAPEGVAAELEEGLAGAALGLEEEVLTGIWSELLGCGVDIHSDFFELGGHSLLATQLLSRLRDVFGVALPVRRIFETPTVAGLAQAIREARGAALPELPPLVPAPRPQEGVSLSSAQERLWILDRLEPGRAAYVMAGALRLRGRLLPDALQAALSEVVRRHEVLRSFFPAVAGEARQVADPERRCTIAPAGLTEDLEALISREVSRPFDLEGGPVLRATLVRAQDDEHVLVLALHHIVADGWSIGLLAHELAVLYNAFATDTESVGLPRLAVQYADFAVWQRRWLDGVAGAQLGFWKEALAGVPLVLELPTDRPRPAVQSYRGRLRSFDFPEELSSALRSLGRQRGATLFMTLFAGLSSLLSRWSGQRGFLVGTPVAGRGRVELEPLIGLFANTLVLRADLGGDPSFAELLARTRGHALDAYAHQDLPFERLVAALAPERDLSRTPLFQVMLSLQNQRGKAVELAGLTLEPLLADTGTSRFDLFLSAAETVAGITGSLEYATDLFDDTTIRRLLDQLQTLLTAAAAQPDELCTRLPLLGAGAAHQLLVEWNRPVDAVPPIGLHQLFEKQAAASPDACALICGAERLSYRELDERAGRLAGALRGRGVGPEVLVGISMERSAAMVTAVLGVLKAGGAYLPLDPAFPAERLAMIREDSGALLVLTEEIFSGEPATSNPEPASLAYVLYTSGTTGRPKGVAVTHENAVNFVESIREAPGLEAGEKLLAVTTLSFDIHVLELFLPLSVGATVVLATSEEAADGRRLRDLLQDADALQATPATWRMLIEAGWSPGETPGLRMLCGGEALPRELAERMLERGSELWNLYGPTETTVWSAVCRLETGSVHVGRPIAGTSVHVVDRGGRPVPSGVVGELWIGGAGVSRGYLGRPALTAEKFVPGERGRFYRTGDLARRRADGTLEVLGRLDHQVKVRGFRIELGEVETRLLEQPSVARAAAVARRDSGEEAQLVAYVVPAESEIDAGALREALQAKLPPYMVPSVFVELAELPLTPNGKIDRKALPAPTARPRTAEERVRPRDALELRLASLWEEVLGVDGVGVTDDFFALGGHSLAAVRLMARVDQELGRGLPLSALFQGATVEKLARRLREDAPASASCLVSLRPARGTKERPAVFCVHPAGGNALAYQGLARALGDGQPVYAFQSRGLEDGAEPLERIEDMASFYAGELPEAAPGGPVALLGWSFGGLVAYEMACRLRQAGREVTVVALLDTAVPVAAPELPEDDSVWLADVAAYLAAMERREPAVTQEELRGLEPAEQLRRFLSALEAEGLVPLGVAEDQVRRLLRVYKANVRAAGGYAPRPYDGRVVLLRAAEGSVHRPEVAADPALGWRPLVYGRLEVDTVPGEHLTLLAHDHVEGLAERLRSLLSPEPTAEGAAEHDFHLTSH